MDILELTIIGLLLCVVGLIIFVACDTQDMSSSDKPTI